jgi:hypothetical protein
MTGNIQHGYAVPFCSFLVTGWFARAALKQAAGDAASTHPRRSTVQHV